MDTSLILHESQLINVNITLQKEAHGMKIKTEISVSTRYPSHLQTQSERSSTHMIGSSPVVISGPNSSPLPTAMPSVSDVGILSIKAEFISHTT